MEIAGDDEDDDKEVERAYREHTKFIRGTSRHIVQLCLDLSLMRESLFISGTKHRRSQKSKAAKSIRGPGQFVPEIHHQRLETSDSVVSS